MPNPNPPNQFKPGQSGNPNGRPKKGWTMAEMYREAMEEMTETGEPKAKIIAKKLIEKANDGDVTAIKELNNRIDGMPAQNLNVGGSMVNKVIVEFSDYGSEAKSNPTTEAEDSLE